MTKALVLVHGCGEDPSLWDATRAQLHNTPVVAPALPGRPPTGGEPVESAGEAAEWLQHFIADAGITQATVVGHSFGGAVALAYALRRPPELVGLGLVSTGARLRVHPAVLQLVAEAARTDVPADLSSFLYIRNDPADVPPATTARDWEACNRFDEMDAVSTIQTPTLVVGGTADAMTKPKYAQYLAATIPGARLEMIEGAGHMLPVEAPGPLARALGGFYSEGAPPDEAT